MRSSSSIKAIQTPSNNRITVFEGLNTNPYIRPFAEGQLVYFMSATKPAHELIIDHYAKASTGKVWVIDAETKRLWGFAVPLHLLAASRLDALEGIKLRLEATLAPLRSRLNEAEATMAKITAIIEKEKA